MIDWVKGCGLLFPLLCGITEFCVAMATPNMEIDSIKGTEKIKSFKNFLSSPSSLQYQWILHYHYYPAASTCQLLSTFLIY